MTEQGGGSAPAVWFPVTPGGQNRFPTKGILEKRLEGGEE